jgi:cytochrome c-type biogenesis protein CcmH
MSERARNLTVIAVIIVMAGVVAAMVSTRPMVEDRVAAIGARIKCPVCQGESIADSPATMASDMMDLIAERVDQGATDEEIVEELLASYSGAVLLDPPFSGQTLLLWLTPLLVIAIGATVIVWWRRHPGTTADDEETAAARSPRRRRALIGAVVLTGSFAVIVVVAAGSLQERNGAATGVADLGEQDLSEVSKETMEAVIAANADNPEVNGMRLALADRYYQALDYRSAFPHYLAVAESPEASADQAITALVRLGWMAYDGNGEVDTALTLIDSALDIDPASQAALYMKGTILWCGAGDNDAAAAIFTELLDNPDLDDSSRHQIESDLDQASAGEGCE